METKAAEILAFYDHLSFTKPLPDQIQIMNPYQESSDIRSICHKFYHKYYNDSRPRNLILGINPGRLGAGATGLPFTDTKRLNDHCGIAYNGFTSHEPSSVYIYEMISAYGGPESFYSNFYISSVCPLGFTIEKPNSKPINYNYYDNVALQNAVLDFIIWNIETQIKICGISDICFCLGSGKNFTFLKKLNEKYHFFKHIAPLEHPRFIMQYKSKSKEMYIDQYLIAFDKYAKI